MARLKNEDRLCGAFYQAHSFLDFDIKTHNQNTGPLSDANFLGINLPGVIRYQEQATEDVKKRMGAYAGICRAEYDIWIDALKFQFNSSGLHDILPPKAVLNDFFGDLHIRVPHESTLLINQQEAMTTILHVKEMRTDKTIKIFKSKAKGGYTSLFGDKAARAIIKNIKGWKTESVLSCRVTFVYHVSVEDIYKPNRFKKETIDLLTRPKVTHYPMSFIFPCGLTIKESEKIVPTIFEDTFQLSKPEDYGPYAPIKFPYSTKPIEGHYLQFDHTEKETLKDKIWKRMNKQYQIDEKEYVKPNATLWRAAFQTLVHISVLTHPDFKDFCVNMLKKDGMQPHRTPYNKDNPYKSRPGWRPAFEHYVVTINVPDDVSKEADASSHKKRRHLVRGHLMRSHSPNSTDGFVWRKSHWRGNREIGLVTKDYVMDIDERINQPGENHG